MKDFLFLSFPTYKHMATVTIAQLTSVLQKVIDPMLRDLFVPSSKSPLVRLIKEGGGQGTTEAPNNTFYVTVKYGRHSNMQTQPDDATLIRGRGRDAQPYFKTKTLAGAFTFTLKSKKVSDSRAGAIVDTLVNETSGLMERAKSQMAFYANNDGTGVVCLVNDSTPNSQTAMPIDTVRANDISMLLDVGDSIHIGTAAERLTGDGFPTTVSSIDSKTQITIADTSTGLADNDLVYFSEAYDTVNAEETSKIGVDGLLATSGTVQNIGLATALYYQAHVNTTSEVITTTRILEYVQLADARVKDSSQFMITLGDLWWKVVDLFRGTVQGDPHVLATILNGGARGLQVSWFGGTSPIIFDPYCRPGYVNGIDTNNIGYKQLFPLGLVDDASALAHRVTQKLEFEVAAAEDGNFYVIDPRACFKLSGKTTA